MINERKEVRIVSDSTYVTGVKVYVGDVVMDNITDIKIRMLPESFIEAEIKVVVSNLDIKTKVDIIEVCPMCNETLDGNSKLAKLKRMAKNIIHFDDNFDDKYFKEHVLNIAKYFIKEIEDI